MAVVSSEESQQDPKVKAILSYLRQRGYQFVSYERIRQRIDPTLTDQKLDEMIGANLTVFNAAKLKGGKRGLKKLIP